MDELIAQLLALAVAWSGYTAPATAPVVHIVPAAQIPCPCAGFYAYRTRFHGYSQPETTGEVLLRDDVDLRGSYGRSILLHELVHSLQAQRGAAEFGTPQWYQREREAYWIQHRYLRADRLAAHKERRLPPTDY